MGPSYLKQTAAGFYEGPFKSFLLFMNHHELLQNSSKFMVALKFANTALRITNSLKFTLSHFIPIPWRSMQLSMTAFTCYLQWQSPECTTEACFSLPLKSQISSSYSLSVVLPILCLQARTIFTSLLILSLKCPGGIEILPLQG